MTFRILVITLLTTLVLVGCKLVIQVPAGGQVITQSGSYGPCAAGKTCVIDITDLFFNESFVAKPGAAYVFKHWKKKAGAFCGGKKGACKLQSAPLGTDPGLMALLESNQRFFLQPVFEKKSDDGGGAVSQQNAAVCFSTLVEKAGTKMVTNYKSVDEAFGDVTRSRIATRFTGYTMYKGVRSLRTLNDITIPGETSFKSSSVTYSLIDKAKKRFTNLGGEAETTVNGSSNGSAIIENMPGQLIRFDLAAGQGYNQKYTVKSTVMVGGNKFESSQPITQRTNYIGVVKQTVPAGTYNTCKFEEVTTASFQGVSVKTTRTVWYAVGSGIQIKDKSEGITTELTSGNIDGVAI
jgi:hypothetical protein